MKASKEGRKKLEPKNGNGVTESYDVK